MPSTSPERPRTSRFIRWTAYALALPLLFAGTGISPDGIGRKLNQAYGQDRAGFTESLDRFDRLAGNAAEREAAFYDLRNAFTRVGFLLEYIDPAAYRLFNGPPVPAEDRTTPGFHAISPEGLQVLEEALCDDAGTEALRQFTGRLRYQWTLYEQRISREPTGRDEFIRALQIHLIRVETLTMAGWNHPCLDNRMAELRTSAGLFVKYLGLLPGADAERALALAGEWLQALERAGSPDGLEYASHIKSYIQPLRAALAGLLPAAETGLPQPVNHRSASLYEAGFLNAGYYGAYGMADTIDPRKAALGKRLFNDPVLSDRGQVSCATCHQPDRYFTDGMAIPLSPDPRITQQRNTPTLIHAAYQSRYMYDGRSENLEDQMLHVFGNRLEFQSHTTAILEKLRSNDAYQQAFSEIYGDGISLYALTDAISVYMRSLTGHDSPFDRYMRGELDSLPATAISGFNIFMKKGACGTCHFAPVFSGLTPPFYLDSELENLGVPALGDSGKWVTDPDEGRFHFYTHKAFRHYFKTPTVRNADGTAPYMHNGSLATLQAVLDFYNNGGGRGAGLDYPNQTLAPDYLGLSRNEIMDLIAFMESLTDPAFANNK